MLSGESAVEEEQSSSSSSSASVQDKSSEVAHDESTTITTDQAGLPQPAQPAPYDGPVIRVPILKKHSNAEVFDETQGEVYDHLASSISLSLAQTYVNHGFAHYNMYFAGYLQAPFPQRKLTPPPQAATQTSTAEEKMEEC